MVSRALCPTAKITRRQGNSSRPAGVSCQKAGQPASLCQDIRDPVAEQDPASQFLNLFPKAPYRVDEPVGSHMGFGLPQDLLRRAAGGELLKDKTGSGDF